MYLKVTELSRGTKISKLSEFGDVFRIKMVDLHHHGESSKLNCFYTGLYDNLINAKKNIAEYFSDAKGIIFLKEWVMKKNIETSVCNVFALKGKCTGDSWSLDEWYKYSESINRYIKNILRKRFLSYRYTFCDVPGMIMVQFEHRDLLEKSLCFKNPAINGDTLIMSDDQIIYLYADTNKKSNIFFNKRHKNPLTKEEMCYIREVFDEEDCSRDISEKIALKLFENEKEQRSEIETNYKNFLHSAENIFMYNDAVNGLYNGKAPSDIASKHENIFAKLHQYEDIEDSESEECESDTFESYNLQNLSPSSFQLIHTIKRGIKKEKKRILGKNSMSLQTHDEVYNRSSLESQHVGIQYLNESKSTSEADGSCGLSDTESYHEEQPERLEQPERQQLEQLEQLERFERQQVEQLAKSNLLLREKIVQSLKVSDCYCEKQYNKDIFTKTFVKRDFLSEDIYFLHEIRKCLGESREILL